MPPKSPVQAEGATAWSVGTVGKAGRGVDKAASKMEQDDPFDLIDALLTKKARGGSPKTKSPGDRPHKSDNDSADDKSRLSPECSSEKLVGAVKITPFKRKAPSGTDSPSAKRKPGSALDSAKRCVSRADSAPYCLRSA